MDTSRLNELRDRAYEAGVKVRDAFMKMNAKQSLHIYIYRMHQAVRYEQMDSIMDLLAEAYCKYGLLVPSVIVDCINDQEKFALVIRAYLLGMLS